jgi:hypothetical protein
MEEEIKEEWQLILEEYKTLREEQFDKMERQYQITGLGVGGIATLLAAAYQYKIYPIFLILPLVILALMALYEAESCAIIRAGEYIKKLESEIIIEHKDLGWERWLASSEDSCLPSEKTGKKFQVYDIIDNASRIILFLLFLVCITGILTVSNDSEFIIRTEFRYLLAILYSALGVGLFLFYWIKQNKKRIKFIRDE